ncbi:hypothetical protein [Pseudonocardia sp. NPDC046786]
MNIATLLRRAALDRLSPVYASADAHEGHAAFRDHRTPVWKGA